MELLANAVYALWMFRLSTRFLMLIVCVSAVALLYAGVEQNSFDFGSVLNSFNGGILRICFSFTFGIVLHRMASGAKSFEFAWYASPTLLLIIAAMLLVAPIQPHQHGSVIFDIFCVFLVFPVIVWVAAHVEPRKELVRF